MPVVDHWPAMGLSWERTWGGKRLMWRATHLRKRVAAMCRACTMPAGRPQLFLFICHAAAQAASGMILVVGHLQCCHVGHGLQACLQQAASVKDQIWGNLCRSRHDAVAVHGTDQVHPPQGFSHSLLSESDSIRLLRSGP